MKFKRRVPEVSGGVFGVGLNFVAVCVAGFSHFKCRQCRRHGKPNGLEGQPSSGA